MVGSPVDVAGMSRVAVLGAAEAVVLKYTDKSRVANPSAGDVAVACPSVLLKS